MIRERTVTPSSGYLALGLLLPLLLAWLWLFVTGVRTEAPIPIVAAILGAAVTVFLLAGLFMVEPD